jgi:flagellar L-ring protein precursor FlgH
MAVGALLALWVGALQAGSIWDKARGKGGSITADDTARRVGDNITILISEKSVIANETSRDMNKKSDRTLKSEGTINWGSISSKTTTMPTADLSTNAETKFEGEAKFDSSRSVADEITVTVQDILPNGNLVVLGTRMRSTQGDQEIIEVSGIVRPTDVTFRNTVLSTKVADFRIVYRAKGQEKQFTNPGWFDQILNFINPF